MSNASDAVMTAEQGAWRTGTSPWERILPHFNHLIQHAPEIFRGFRMSWP
jgi:hypothetical protein